MKRRVLSIILSVCMLCSLLPTTAFAASCDGADCNHVAAIGSEHYNFIQEAINAAQTGSTITLLRSIDLGTDALTVTGAGQKTIDFNGFTITSACSGQQMLYVTGGSELTLLDNSNDKDGGLYATKDDGTLSNLIRVATDGRLIIESGSYHQVSSNNGSGMIDSRGDEIITVNGGTFLLGNIGTASNGSPWIFNTSGQNTQNIIVNGGTFNDDILHLYYPFEVQAPKERALKKIDDSTWTMVDAVAYVNESHKSGSWYTNEVGYTTFEEAVKAAEEYASAAASAGKTSTITLLTDCHIDEIQLTENINIDLNDKKLILDTDIDTDAGDAFIDTQGGGTLTIEEPVVEKVGYEFVGWFSDAAFETPFNFEAQGSTTIKNTTLYIKWVVIPYNITYSLNEGTVDGSNPATYTVEAENITLTNPTKTGYTFVGWTGTDLTGPAVAITIPAGSTGDRTYTANWTANQYNVELHVDGGTINSGDVENYIYGFGAELPTDVVKFGYDFGGWYDNAECTGTPVTEIGNADLGDKKYYAKWTPAQLTGTVTITGTVQVGETLTATVSDSNNTGALSYKWYRHAEDSVLMGESANNVYVITEDAVAQKIYCVVSSDVQTGTRVSEKTSVVPNLIFPVGAISAEGYIGTYDGQPNSITVTAPEGTTVYYGTDGENYDLNASPSYTDAGTYTVYYRVVKDNYDGVSGSAVVDIGKADPTVAAWPTVKGIVYVNDNAVVLNDDGTVTGVDAAALDGDFAVGAVDLTSAGQKTVIITFTPTDNTNYNLVEKADYQVTVRNRPAYSDDYDPTYSVAVADCKNGTVQLNRRYAESGQTLAIIIEPNTGYVLETLTVKTSSGREIELTKKADNKYTFKMPSSKVIVEATFMEDNTMLNYFVDVFATDYYYDAVLWAVENGITNGTSATTFSPSNPCTRAQMATFLWRAAGSPEPAGNTNPFTDVSTDAYYAKAVQWAYEQGITGGTSAATFSPDETCTRGQMATFLWRSADSSAVSGEGAPFVDVPTDVYYATAVEWAYEQSITGGTSATTFSPNDPCTRGQMMTFLCRFFVK